MLCFTWYSLSMFEWLSAFIVGVVVFSAGLRGMIYHSLCPKRMAGFEIFQISSTLFNRLCVFLFAIFFHSYPVSPHCQMFVHCFSISVSLLFKYANYFIWTQWGLFVCSSCCICLYQMVQRGVPVQCSLVMFLMLGVNV